MQERRTTWSLEWLATPTLGTLRFDRGWEDLERTPIPLPEGGGGFIELHHLGQGMDIFRAMVSFPPAFAGRLLPLGAVKGSVPEPMFGVQSVHLGTMVVKERRADVELLVGKDHSLFQHVDRLDFETHADASQDLDLTVITMGVPVLASLIGQDSAESLLAVLGIQTMPSVSTRVLPHSLNQILHSTLPASLSGRMRILFSQAKTLEYLCALSALTFEKKEAETVGSRVESKVADLREELRKLEGKVPMIDELAERYGISARSMNDEFRRRYGKTIYAFVTDHRLAESHVALQSTDIPMKVLAANLGYSHVNHFITAFRNKFGYPPGKVRNSPDREAYDDGSVTTKPHYG